MRIQKLRKLDGIQIETRGDIEEELSNYFLKILREDNHDRERDIAKITRLIPSTITRENNEMLIKLVSLREVQEAVQ